MPCVLPVLGLKVSAIIGASELSSGLVRKQFISSAAGIITSFWLLALLVIGLKLSGNTLGWGIQFQHAGFLAFMVLVTGLFSANLFGLFEFRLPSVISTRLTLAGDNSVSGHFIQGMFATLLATPCSAPFSGNCCCFCPDGG